ncbi:hypothetical protein [Peptostreptococcus porci]|uniref:hypothetical protein n=1 Tax=Peptostreptococcus porci TaxID=2652282 RepID=UPI002A91B61F|nr:hypothetical protein [Peptostreptococcus porci]MDY6232409.1 hypothetical protein [Peptostreptococcus porci]
MRNSCISSKNTNLNSIQDAYKDFLNDPILAKRNSLLIELSNIIKSNDIREETVNEFLAHSYSLIDYMSQHDAKISKCIIDISNNPESPTEVVSYLSCILNKHRIWKRNLKNINYVFENLDNIYNVKMPKYKSVHYLKFSSTELINDFPNMYYYKNYDVNKILSTTIMPNDLSTDTSDGINSFDLLILRAIFSFYDNNIFAISYKNLSRYISFSDSYIITNNLLKKVKSSVRKLLNTNVLIRDNLYNHIYVEKLIYAIDNEYGFVVFQEIPIYSFSIEHNLYTKLNYKFFDCPVSMTDLNIAIREYLIYQLVNIGEGNDIFFEDFYSNIKITDTQMKKKSREVIIRILEYWKNNNLIYNYSINKIQNKYISFSFSR